MAQLSYIALFPDDFKPLSVDLSKTGRLKTEGEEVNMSLPLVQVRQRRVIILLEKKMLLFNISGLQWNPSVVGTW